MKRIAAIIFFSIATLAVLGQRSKAVTFKVTEGTTVTYHSMAGTQPVELILTISSIDVNGVKLDYTVTHKVKSFKGKIIVPREGVDNGTMLNWDDLAPNKENTVDTDETAFFFSVDFYKKLLSDGKATYNKIIYEVRKIPEDQQLVLNKKTVDVLYIVSPQNGARFWILKDATLPVIMKMAGNVGNITNIEATNISKK